MSFVLEASTMADPSVGKPESDVQHNNIEARRYSVASVDLNKNTDAKYVLIISYQQII
jgi:hypothetical protein